MMLRNRQNVFRPANFALASAGVLGTAQKFTVDSTWPIEEIILLANVTAGGTGPTLTGADSILGLIRNVNISVNDGNQTRSVVDFSGVGLLEYASLAGLNLSPETWESVRLSKLATIPANQKFQIAYRIPMVHPLIDEPLRSRMCLPVHTMPQDAVITATFESGANMYSAGSLAAVTVDVIVIRRSMTAAATEKIMGSGGFIPFDLIETANSIAVGVSGTQRFTVPTPGAYLNLLFRQYLGGAAVTRAVIDQVTTFGAESLWRIESGGVSEREWTWKGLKEINAWSRTQNALSQPVSAATGTWAAPTSAGSPTVAFDAAPAPGFITAGLSTNPAVSTMQDYLTDGLNGANELGSVLDCNTPVRTGLKVEVVGPVASVATNGSTLYIGGHRLFGDLSQWQAVR